MSTPFDQALLRTYVRKFTKLRQGGTQYGKAPHKPVFLISLLELIDRDLISDNRITITPELVATFKENFSLLVKTAHKDDFTQPFFYLQNDGFWFLKAQAGYYIDHYIRSVHVLNDKLDYGYFANDLFALLTNTEARTYLKMIVLDHYFGNTKADFLAMKNAGRSYLHDLETYLLNEKEAAYEQLRPS